MPKKLEVLVDEKDQRRAYKKETCAFEKKQIPPPIYLNPDTVNLRPGAGRDP